MESWTRRILFGQEWSLRANLSKITELFLSKFCGSLKPCVSRGHIQTQSGIRKKKKLSLSFYRQIRDFKQSNILISNNLSLQSVGLRCIDCWVSRPVGLKASGRRLQCKLQTLESKETAKHMASPPKFYTLRRCA